MAQPGSSACRQLLNWQSCINHFHFREIMGEFLLWYIHESQLPEYPAYRSLFRQRQIVHLGKSGEYTLSAAYILCFLNSCQGKSLFRKEDLPMPLWPLEQTELILQQCLIIPSTPSPLCMLTFLTCSQRLHTFPSIHWIALLPFSWTGLALLKQWWWGYGNDRKKLKTSR